MAREVEFFVDSSQEKVYSKYGDKRSKENGTQENRDQPHPALTLWAAVVAE